MKPRFSQYLRSRFTVHASRFTVAGLIGLALALLVTPALAQDSDYDGLDDYDEEYTYYTDPYNADTDGDTYSDGDEVLTYFTDPLDPYSYPGPGPGFDDFDSDGLSDDDESNLYFTDPYNSDSDYDGHDDGAEVAAGTDPLDPNDYPSGGGGGGSDSDSDGLSDAEELSLGTDPGLSDTDGDGYNDGDEVISHGTDPLDQYSYPGAPDTDGDGLSDDSEIHVYLTDPNESDTDDDNFSDGVEVAAGTDPLNAASHPAPNDADSDTLPDTWELVQGLNPFDASDASRDFDYDGVSNLAEAAAGTPANTSWLLTPVPEGGVSTLNDRRQLLRHTSGGDLVRWESGVWSPAGSFGGWSPLSPSNLAHNNRSLRVGWSGVAFRVLEPGASMPYESEADLPSGITGLVVKQVTDSGFVFGQYIDGAGKLAIFRYRAGVTERFAAPGGSHAVFLGGSRRGEILAKVGYAIQWIAGAGWESPGADIVAMAEDGTLFFQAGTTPSHYVWRANASGDALKARETSNFTYPPLNEEKAHFYAPGFPVAIFGATGEPNLVTGLRRSVIVNGLTRAGDYFGYLYDPDSQELGLDGITQMGTQAAFVWRPGGTFLGEISINSSMVSGNGNGVFGIAYSEEVSVDVDTDGDTVPESQEWQYQGHEGLLLPLNDADANGLPDGWEAALELPATTGVANLDTDSLTNFEEFIHRTNPQSEDTDSDGFNDDFEIDAGMDPLVADVTEDVDGDGLGWAAEFTAGTSPYHRDTDGDGLTDADEIQIHVTDPLDRDSDNDGFDDGLEVSLGLDPNHYEPGDSDFDEDGLTLHQELLLGTDPGIADTDGDGFDDGVEVNGLRTDPLTVTVPAIADDPDGDGLDAVAETAAGTDPLDWDTNDDGISDGASLAIGIDPVATDHDGDGLTNAEELALGTDPFEPDTDGDGVNDAVDAFPLDPARSTLDVVPGDNTAPEITLHRPFDAELIQ